MLRTFNKNTREYNLYKGMYENQTYEFAKSKRQFYSKLNNGKMKMCKALELMNKYIDPSDPDVNDCNLIHLYQTAERIRHKYPTNYEYQLCGLIHDVGKLLYTFGEPDWAIVGDTFVVGAEYGKALVYGNLLKNNTDINDIIFRTKFGIYSPNCGVKKLTLSFGHDEYLYIVLKNNKNHRLSEKYLDIIRFHSFYPWHTGGDYSYFMSKEDETLKQNILDFNQFDLYSKTDEKNISQETKDYYKRLLEEYFPEELDW